MFTALAQAPQLQTVTAWTDLSGTPRTDQLALLPTNPSFRHLFLQVHKPVFQNYHQVAPLEWLPPILHAYVRVVPASFCGTSYCNELASTKHLATPANEFSIPLAQVPHQDRIKIWTRILRFALTLNKPVSLPSGHSRRHIGTSFDFKWVDFAGASACLSVSEDFQVRYSLLHGFHFADKQRRRRRTEFSQPVSCSTRSTARTRISDVPLLMTHCS